MDIKPYEISIWNDYLADTADHYLEKKIAVIGSNEMTSNQRAIAPKFTKKITGEFSLEFTLYTQYFNEDIGDFEDNPYIKLLSNETKIKLKYDNEWYDFIIKNIIEASDQKSFTYVAEALFINELSKNGFGIVFNSELENSTGTIQELVTKTLEGTDWNLDNENSELVQQKKEEPLYKLTTIKEINAKYRSIDGLNNNEIDIIIPSGKDIYAFYSTINDRNTFFQFNYVENNIYQLDDDNVITNSECYFIYNFNYNNFSEYFSQDIDYLKVDEKRGNRLVQSIKNIYDNRIGQFVNLYTKNDRIYRGYTKTIYKTTDYVQNLVTNPSEFQSKTGWEGISNLSLNLDVYPPILDNSGNLNNNCKQYIKVVSNLNYPVVYNTGIIDNRKLFMSKDGDTGGIKLGQKYVLHCDIFQDNNGIPGQYFVPQIIVATYTINNNDFVINDELIHFNMNSPSWKYSRIYLSNSTFKAGQYYIYDEVEEEFVISNTYDSKAKYYKKDRYYIAEVNKAITYSELLTKKVGIIIQFGQESNYWIQKLDLFQYTENNLGDIITPDPVAIDGFYETHYFYFDQEQYKDAISAEEISCYESIGEDISYKIIEDAYYTKYRSYEASESNRLNIIEELCELFECWAEFKIGHETDGSVKIIDNYEYIQVTITEEEFYQDTYFILEDGIYVPAIVYNPDSIYYKQIYIDSRYDKNVIIKNFIGKENFIGFKYGINLKSTKRDLDSKDIVSKIIVKDNTNEYAIDGYCSISRARENPCGESFLYDFRHYYNNGMLNYAQVLNDFYTYDGVTPWLGYYKRMKQINSTRLDTIEQISILANQITNLEASVQAYENLKDESYTINQENLYYINSFKIPFTYEHYTGQNHTYDSGTPLGNSYDPSTDPIRNYKGVYISLSSIDFTPVKNDSVIIYNKDTPAVLPKEYVYNSTWELLDAIALKTFGEELSALKETLSVINYLTAVKTSSDALKKYTELYTQYKNALDGYGNPEDENYVEGARPKYNKLLEQLEEAKTQKEELNSQFYAKYSRFIQEGSWTDDNYTDDNLYYYDAESTLATSAQPKVSYTISVLELSAVEDYENYTFDVGDKTTIEDVEFFGWNTKTSVKTPYKEEVIISEITWNLEQPENNTIKIQNYKTRFEDLFQRITATTTSLEFAQGSYNVAASAVTTTGAIQGTSLQSAFEQNAITVSNIQDQTVIWDDTGITISNKYDPNNILRLYNGGISLFNGNSWNVGISGNGINATYLSAGQLDVSKVRIMNGAWATYNWDSNGLTAYAFSQQNGIINSINTNQFTRLDQYGFYGVKNNSEWIATNLQDVLDTATYGLTWGGFFFKAAHGQGMVKISDTDDIVVRVNTTDGYIDRIKIGAIDKYNGEYIYGIVIRNSENKKSFYTNDQGDLWLSHTITIAEEYATSPLVQIGYLDALRTGTNYHEVIHAGNPELGKASEGEVVTSINDIHMMFTDQASVNGETLNMYMHEDSNYGEFIVYEDGHIHANDAVIDGTIIARSGTIGGLSIEDIGTSYSIKVLALQGTTVKDKSTSGLKCLVYLHDNEVSSTSYRHISYQWMKGNTILEGQTTNEIIVSSNDWGDEDILQYTCLVNIQED